MSSERKPPDDSDLEDFLAGRHPVGRAYREITSGETAPRELDDAILRMARQHAAAPPPQDDVPEKSDVVRALPVRRRPRWLQPLAVAATLALSLGVLMNIWRHPEMREQAVPVKEGMPAAPATPRPAPAPRPKVELPSAESRIEEQLKAFGTLSQSMEIQRDRAAPAPPAQPAKPDPSIQESRRAARAFPGDAAAEHAAPREERSLDDALSPSATSPRADSATAAAAAAPPPPPSAPPAPAAQAGGAGMSLPEPDPYYHRYSIQPSPPAPVLQEPEQKKREADEDARPLAKEKAIRESMAADAAAPAAEDESAPQDRAARDRLIERARAAVARGDDDEARRLVVELQRLYPDEVLPQDLRPLAPPAR